MSTKEEEFLGRHAYSTPKFPDTDMLPAQSAVEEHPFDQFRESDPNQRPGDTLKKNADPFKIPSQ